MSSSEDEFYNYPLKRKLTSDKKSEPEPKKLKEIGEKPKPESEPEKSKLKPDVSVTGRSASNSSSEEEFGDNSKSKELQSEVFINDSSEESCEEGGEIFEDIIKKHESSFKCNRFCTKNCKANVCVKDLETLQKEIEGLQYLQLRQYLLTLLLKQGQFHLDDETFRIGSINVCCKYFSSATKVSKYIAESVITDYHSGVKSYNENLTRNRFSAEEAQFKAYVLNFATQYGESCPTGNSVSMPSYLTRTKMFHNYSEEASGKLYTYSSFCRLLKKHFGPQRMNPQEFLISFPKESKHSKCDQCLSLKQLKRKAKTKQQQELASSLLDAHHKRIGYEREYIWKLIEASKRFPLEFMYIGFDDMDQQKISFPRQTSKRKSLGSMFIMRSHLTGVQIYSGLLPETTKNILILNVGQFEQGSNKSVSILHQTLLDFKNQYGRLPLVLHVGADNCWRENKNKYVFGYLSALVKFGIFKEVTFNFLPVGHTHDTVDRMFGRIADALKKQDTNSCDELLTQLSQVPLKPEAVVKELLYTWNWKDFVMPNFERPIIENHSCFRVFKFTDKGTSSKMNYKLWSTDKEWVPNTGIRLLVDEVDFDAPIVSTQFRIEQINLDKIVSDVITKYIPILPKSKQVKVSDQWLKFSERIKKLPDMTLKPMKLSDLSQNTQTLPVSVDIDEWCNKGKNKPKEIVGAIIPEAEEGDFRADAKPGMDACVYTQEKEERPWLIRVRQVNPEERTFTGDWLHKLEGINGNVYTLDKVTKRKKAPVTLRTETVLLFGFTENITDDGCSVSEYWMNRIMKLYNDHDHTFV